MSVPENEYNINAIITHYIVCMCTYVIIHKCVYDVIIHMYTQTH